jgi:hypothetical protein
MPEATVYYTAKSDFQSKTILINSTVVLIGFIVQYLRPDMFPAEYGPMVVAGLAFLNIIMRKFTTRPTAFIPPGETKAVEVEKL